MATQIDVDDEGNEYALSLSSDTEADQIIELIAGGITKLNDVNGEVVPGYFANKLQALSNTKDGIAVAIEAKGVEVPANTNFASYENLIEQIQGGSALTEYADDCADELLNILGEDI
jgi:hypothetical protein